MADLLHPTRDWYIIKRFEDNKVSPGGIELPDAAVKKHPFGRILAAGPGKPCDFAYTIDEDGDGAFPLLPMSAQQGDVVFFSEQGARKLKLEGIGDVYAVNEIDIIGIVEQNADTKVDALKEAGLI